MCLSTENSHLGLSFLPEQSHIFVTWQKHCYLSTGLRLVLRRSKIRATRTRQGVCYLYAAVVLCPFFPLLKNTHHLPTHPQVSEQKDIERHHGLQFPPINLELGLLFLANLYVKKGDDYKTGKQSFNYSLKLHRLQMVFYSFFYNVSKNLDE